MTRTLSQAEIQYIEDNLPHKAVRKIAKDLWNDSSRESLIRYNIGNGTIRDTRANKAFTKKPETTKPKVLILDVETSPVLAYVWALFKQNVGLNQIHSEWYILSYAAKWLGDDEIYYNDLRGIVAEQDDTMLLDELWKLLDEADIVVTQNGKKFDIKKIKARMVLNGFQPFSPFKHIDTLEIAKREFGFTSNKLAWMTDHLCEKHKKLDHGAFAGFELWSEMMKDNIKAWDECKLYNIGDITSLEELYLKIAPWDSKHPNFNLYHDELANSCATCGSTNIVKAGFAYTQKSKFQQWRCEDCGHTTRDSINHFSKEKRKALHVNIYN